MQRRVLNLFFAVLLFAACGPQGDPKVSAGHLDSYPAFPSQYVTPRTVRVWTPSDYDAAKRYDVLYMHDGQMLFDSRVAWNHQEWGVDEAMDSLISSGKIRPCIVVGIDNTDERIGEYSPDDITEFMTAGKPVYNGIQSQGNAYLQFLVEEVKPFVDSVYSTYPERSHTWVIGSSCGGLISSYALCKYPDVFGGAACLSTHCTLAYPLPQKVDGEVAAAYRSYLCRYLPVPDSTRLYMDCGDETLDEYYAYAQNAINDTLRAAGWDEQHFMYRFFPGAAHCEDDWRARLDIPLQFLLASE